ncbi:MAG: DNA processing protein DprA [Acidobacteria bacterium OLB17]|nr:MAG: DNA processing protein DprA [Acidobacteria bacterium OLB17]
MQQWQDIVAELPAEIGARILPPKTDDRKQREKTQNENHIPNDLSPNEITVYKALKLDEATHIDTLVETCGLTFGDLNSALVSLDIKDLIRVLPGKCYAKKA